MATTIEEIGQKVKNFFQLENWMDSIPIMLTVGGGLLIGNQVLGLGEKLKPVYEWMRQYNKQEFLEFIDTVADNLELVDKVAALFGIEDVGEWTDKIADWLQEVSALAKWFNLGAMGFKKFSKGRRLE